MTYYFFTSSRCSNVFNLQSVGKKMPRKGTAVRFFPNFFLSFLFLLFFLFSQLINVDVLTLCLQAFAQLGLGLSVGSESGLGVELVGHGGGRNHGLQAARALGHILLGVEQNHVHLRHVEQPEGHGGAQAHGDGQRGRLDVHLQGKQQSMHNNGG